MRNSKSSCVISVFTDLGKSTETVIETALSIAKVTGGSMDIFHVKKCSKIVHSDNQLSASRSINNEYVKTEKKIEELITKYSTKYNVAISYSFSFGNIKNNIEVYLEKNNPDILVIGKQSSAPIRFLGNGVTDLVLKRYKGELIIADEENKLVPDALINMGFLNKLQPFKNFEFFTQITKNVIEPIKTFQFTDKVNHDKKAIEFFKNKKMVEFIFEKSSNVVNNLSKYLQKNNINLLCLSRTKSELTGKELDVSDVLNKLNISLLVTTN